MLPVVHELKVLRPIVKSVPVDVVNVEMCLTSAYPRPRNGAVVFNPYCLGTGNHPRYYPNPGPPLKYLYTIAFSQADKLGRVSCALPAFPVKLTPASGVPASGTPRNGTNSSTLPSNGLGRSVTSPELVMLVTPTSGPDSIGTRSRGASLFHFLTSLWSNYTPYGGLSQQGDS